ncbi:MAG: hypothetical protein HKM93_15630 [Desulfobacteraceae bacterium]|nr:hypothetical protein [Desulfobacteraceae bacterium]
MASLEDYVSGKAVADAKKALAILQSGTEDLRGTPIGGKLTTALASFSPRLVDMAAAGEMIEKAHTVAVGVRMCKEIDPESTHTEAVFLDDLAEAMIAAGKANPAAKPDAMAALRKYPENRLVVSKIEGKYQEICRSCRETCVGWHMERRGLKCFNR